MKPEPGDRRRFATSYALSLIVHGIALVVLLLITFDVGGESTETFSPGDVTIVRADAPVAVPTAAPPSPRRPVPAPPVGPRPRPIVPTPPPRRPELARNVLHAPANPTARPTTVPPTAPPTTTPTRAPTAVPTMVVLVTAPPSAAPTLTAPSEAPTAAPTTAPTTAPTIPPTAVPTAAPTVRPTAVPTTAPTQVPTAAPTQAPNAVPTVRPTVAPTAAAATTAPTPAPIAATAAPQAAATASAVPLGTPRPAAFGSPRPEAGAATGPAASPGPVAAAANATPEPAAAPSAAAPADAPPPPVPGPTPAGLDSLNAKLKAALQGGSVDYRSTHVKVYDPREQRDRIVAAYEAALAPPPEILGRTFGIVRKRRTAATPDSVAYVFERTTVLGFPVCKAYKITEHPYPPGAADTRSGVPDLGRKTARPEVEIVTIYPCNEGSYVPVKPGSLATPVPRHEPERPPLAVPR